MDKTMNWDEYFVAISVLCSKRSKDDRTKVGACVVNKNHRLLSTGYNGMPNGTKDDEMPWGLNPDNYLEHKHFYVCHAELNAILNAKRDLDDCILYSTLFPCNECAKAIIQSGIKEICYLSDKFKDYEQFKASKYMLEKAHIKIRKFNSNIKEISLNFENNEEV